MGDTIKDMLTRRSVREFSAEMPPEDKIERIINAGLYAPSGMGRQKTVILAVTDKAARDRLSRINAAVMGTDKDPFYGAPVLLTVLADKTVPTYIEDGSLVMANLLLAAHAEGLAACWIHRAKEEFESPFGKDMLKSLGIPQEYTGIGNCALGYAKNPLPAPAPRKPGRVFYVR